LRLLLITQVRDKIDDFLTLWRARHTPGATPIGFVSIELVFKSNKIICDRRNLPMASSCFAQFSIYLNQFALNESLLDLLDLLWQQSGQLQ